MLKSLWWLPFGKVPEISPAELDDWLNNGGDIQLVDARTTLEYQQGTIGNAVHAPLTEMPGSMERLTLDRARPVIMLCLSGHRSRPGTRWLQVRGYQAFSLKGGIMAWKATGYSLKNQ
jgi:rhodanese-related sulfurtransferase